MKRYVMSLFFILVWFVCKSQTVLISMSYADEPLVEVFVNDIDQEVIFTYEDENEMATTMCFEFENLKWVDNTIHLFEGNNTFVFVYNCQESVHSCTKYYTLQKYEAYNFDRLVDFYQWEEL